MGFIDQGIDMAANTAMGIALGGYNDRRQYRQQQKLQELQIEGNRRMTDYNMMKQLEMWRNTNFGPQIEEMKKAGINPGLIYGMKGGGGITTGTPSGGPGTAAAPAGGREIQDLMGMGIQRQLLQAQKENIEADTKLKQTEATKKAGVDTANVQADTENKILAKVITDYTGREAKEIFERVMQPNRSIQAKTYEDELAARQGVAGTIYELWEEGKLKDKSLYEIEQILLQNSKTREETKNITRTLDLIEQNIKGAKLDNIIKDLESKLQTQTGIDKNSPTWLKILGRLFTILTNK